MMVKLPITNFKQAKQETKGEKENNYLPRRILKLDLQKTWEELQENLLQQDRQKIDNKMSRITLRVLGEKMENKSLDPGMVPENRMDLGSVP